MAIKVPKDVYEGLEAVRVSGVVNMFEIHQVQDLAFKLGYWDTDLWLRENRILYLRGVLEGIEPEEGS